MATNKKRRVPIQVTSLDDFFGKVKRIDENIIKRSENEFVIYRGQENCNWDLLPCIGRSEYFSYEIEKVEEKLFNEFKRRAIPYLPINYNGFSNWDWLAIAQHFKLPTRLLDWTENPLVALYFAFAKEKITKEDRSLWAFIVKPNEIVDTNKKDVDPFSIPKTKVFMPNQITQRISVQSGWFTVHKPNSNKFIPLNINTLYIDRVQQYLFKDEFRIEILTRLNRLGTNSYSIFPDLEGLTSFIKWNEFKI